MKKIVILANGNFPNSKTALAVLKESDIIICCDGSADKLLKFGMNPDFIAGDMDSISLSTKNRFESVTYHSECQETNDLTKAFRLAKTLCPSEIHILGATGAREDHTLGNISLLLNYAKESVVPIDMITDHGKFIAIYDSTTISCKKGMIISIFSFDNTLKIKSAGLLYPTDNVIFDTLWKATLNEATDDTAFSLELSHPSGVLLFLSNSR
jgi:thiamine pyrophosphokinase